MTAMMSVRVDSLELSFISGRKMGTSASLHLIQSASVAGLGAAASPRAISAWLMASTCWLFTERMELFAFLIAVIGAFLSSASLQVTGKWQGQSWGSGKGQSWGRGRRQKMGSRLA